MFSNIEDSYDIRTSCPKYFIFFYRMRQEIQRRLTCQAANIPIAHDLRLMNGNELNLFTADTQLLERPSEMSTLAAYIYVQSLLLRPTTRMLTGRYAVM
jgi:hypothetical protein